MLTKISCPLFRNKEISFSPDLNVVVGDENAANSIGKSYLLLIIDFAFGGSQFLRHATDVPFNLGHHSYTFHFLFAKKKYIFQRNTANPQIVSSLNEQLLPIQELQLSQYTDLLKKMYGLMSEETSFRSMVGLFSRVWGKDNLNVTKPLHAVQKESDEKTIDLLLRLFNRYSAIANEISSLQNMKSRKAEILQAQKNSLIPKITKIQFRQNLFAVKKYSDEVLEIKQDLKKFACNISEIVNREVFDLKQGKDSLLKSKFDLESQLLRIRNHFTEIRHINRKNFEGLLDLLPSINKEKLEHIESFHDGISVILRKRLKESETSILKNLKIINEKIEGIDSRIKNALSSIENPGAIVDRIFSISSSLENAKNENKYYEEVTSLTKRITEAKAAVLEIKQKILNEIQTTISEEIQLLISQIYPIGRRKPSLILGSSNYKFEVIDDTGTGKAFSNLIVFDLAILRLTKLPFIIHDSVLFKNIENSAVSNILKQYLATGKQVFISLDEVQKFGEDTFNFILSKKAIQLTNSSQLYTVDWRKKTNE